MTTWSSEELNKIGNAEELQIASQRRDGKLPSRLVQPSFANRYLMKAKLRGNFN